MEGSAVTYRRWASKMSYMTFFWLKILFETNGLGGEEIFGISK